MNVLEGLSFIKSSPSSSGQMEYRANINTDRQLVDQREQLSGLENSLEKRIARKKLLLETLTKRKDLLLSMINRNRAIEQTTVTRVALPSDGKPGYLSTANLRAVQEAIESNVPPVRKYNISIGFWLFPISRNASLVLENEGSRLAVRSRQDIEFYDCFTTLSLLLNKR